MPFKANNNRRGHIGIDYVVTVLDVSGLWGRRGQGCCFCFVMPDICATKKTMKTRGHMDKLLVAAAAAANAGEVPVAAAIVNLDGQIIALAENRMKRDGNALHHAEMLAIQAAMADKIATSINNHPSPFEQHRPFLLFKSLIWLIKLGGKH